MTTVALGVSAERSNEGSDSVSDLCSTAGANSFLPSIVVYRHGVNLEVNINVASGLNIHTSISGIFSQTYIRTSCLSEDTK